MHILSNIQITSVNVIEVTINIFLTSWFVCIDKALIKDIIVEICIFWSSKLFSISILRNIID